MKKPLMIAHRGYSRYEKENTLIAFSCAGNIEEFYGIETDVHVTTDNVYIAVHDETTNRITNETTCIDVEKSTFKEVSEVVLCDVEGNLRNDLRIPKMIDYFKICKKYNKVAVCELKQRFNKEQLKEILSIINSIDMLKNTIFISFVIENLIDLKEIDKSLKAQFLTANFSDDLIEKLLKYDLDLDIYHKAITKEQVKHCHDNNILVNVWTVDDIEDAKTYASWGIDYITSNHLKEV